MARQSTTLDMHSGSPVEFPRCGLVVFRRPTIAGCGKTRSGRCVPGSRSLLAALLLAAVWWSSAAFAGSGLRVDLQFGPSSFGEITVDGIRVSQDLETVVEISGIAHPEIGELGSIALRCPAQSLMRCGQGRLTWTMKGARPIAFEVERLSDRFRLTGDDGGRLIFRRGGQDRAEISIRDLPAALIPAPAVGWLGLADLSASVSGTLAVDGDRFEGAFRIRQLAFDTPDGQYAGGDLALDLGLDWATAEGRLRIEANWSAGELLLGPAYLPPPEAPVTLEMDAQRLGQEGWRVERVALEQAGTISLAAAGQIVPGDPVRLAALDLEIDNGDIASLWRQGLSSVAGTRGWGQLRPDGQLSGRLRLENGSIASAGLRLADVDIADGDERLAVSGLGVWLGWEHSGEALELGANWQSARLLRIPLGASAFAFRTDGSGTLALVDSFRLPVLDGALVVERLAWRDWVGLDRRLSLDARLEPIDLSALTRALGWTEFGGRLSGNFPGIRLSGSVIDVQGGLELDLFGGSARINGLSIERPFGSLPALAADMEFDSLDLEQVTGAFEFGRMLGLMSGHVRDLRLLDWQPVRFDAWFETLERSPDREISQKAVDSISSLSGGGSAAISGTLLRWFDDFPYRKAGLGCRLAENVCSMRGLRDADNGGYVILEGRLIPRLDIVGYQRRVDWPRLMAQLAAATKSAE